MSGINNRGWLTALLGGITYLALHLTVEIAFPDHWAGSPDRLLGVSYAGWSRLLWVPSLLLLLGLRAVRRFLSASLGKLARLGYWMAAAGFILDISGSVIEFWVFGVFLVPVVGEFTTGSPGSNIGYSISLYGNLLLIAGLVVFGIACLRSQAPARWRMLPLTTGLLYLSALAFYFTNLLVVHAVLYGACWMVVGGTLYFDQPRG